MINAQKKAVAYWKSGRLKLGKEWPDIAGRVVKSVEPKKGSGGKQYIRFVLDDGEAALFFPHAKHGAFVKMEK